jgi:hypothetical protein
MDYVLQMYIGWLYVTVTQELLLSLLYPKYELKERKKERKKERNKQANKQTNKQNIP